MHAYSMQDPVFFALNAREKAHSGEALGNFCVSCHSPIGMLTGATDNFTDPTLLPEVVQAGVTCETCHLANTFTAAHPTLGGQFELHVADSTVADTIFGPMDQVVPNPFHLSIQDNNFDRSIVCMPCHNFERNGVTLEGTFREWQESSFAVRKECQDCHMEEYTGQAAVEGPVRAGLHRHYFTGVDIAMTPFPDSDGQRARVEALLRDSANLIIVPLPGSIAAGDTLLLQTRVQNSETGHALPSGTTFEREMWLEIVVRDAGGDTVYVSGHLDANGDLHTEHSEIDPNGDPDLMLWTKELVDPEGDPETTIFRAIGATGQVIEAETTAMKDYRIRIPEGTQGPLSVSVRLLFRPFKPYVLRDLGVGELAPLNPVFEMNTWSGDLAVTQ